MTTQTQESSISYHLSCIGVILERRADNVLHEYRQLIIGLILGFLLCMAVLLPAVVNTPYEPQAPITTSVPLANTDVELLDTELLGNNTHGFDVTGRFIANNEPITTFECSINGEQYKACSGHLDYSDLPSGNYTLEVRSVLTNGTVDNTPAAFLWSVK